MRLAGSRETSLKLWHGDEIYAGWIAGDRHIYGDSMAVLVAIQAVGDEAVVVHWSCQAGPTLALRHPTRYTPKLAFSYRTHTRRVSTIRTLE